MGVKLKHAKYQRSTPRGALLNWVLNEGVGKICVFQRKTGHISEMVRDTAKVTINH